MLFPIGYNADRNEYKIAEFARMGLMPRGSIHHYHYHLPTMWNPDRSSNGVGDMDGMHNTDRRTLPDQKTFRRWSRRLNGQQAYGTSWVLKDGEQSSGRCSPINNAPNPPFQDDRCSRPAFYPDQRSARFESRFNGCPSSEVASSSSDNSSPAHSFGSGNSYECPRRLRNLLVSPRRYFDQQGFYERHYYRQRSKSQGPYRNERRQQPCGSPEAWSPANHSHGWHPHSERKRGRFEVGPQEIFPHQNHKDDLLIPSQQSFSSPRQATSSPENNPSRTRASVRSYGDVSCATRSHLPRTDLHDRSKFLEKRPSGVQIVSESETRTQMSPCQNTNKSDKWTHRESEQALTVVSPSKKREASCSLNKDIKRMKESPSKNNPRDCAASKTSIKKEVESPLKLHSYTVQMKDTVLETAGNGTDIPRLKIKLIKSTEIPKEDEMRIKSKKKKKRKKRKRNKRKSSQNEISIAPPSIHERNVGKAAESPSKHRSSHEVITNPEKKKEISPKKENSPQKKMTVTPSKRSDGGPVDSSTCFGSGQAKDQSAISNKLPRTELETPSLKSTKRKDMTRQSRTPTNIASNMSKLVRNRSSDAARAAATPTETTFAENQKTSRRSSPPKGDLKPKVLIKPGLRSARKNKPINKASATKRRSRTPPKCDSGPKMVQKTLESYFCTSVSKHDAAREVEKMVDDQSAPTPEMARPPAARSLRRNSNKELPTEQMTGPGQQITAAASQPSTNNSHVRRIYQEDQPRSTVETSRPPVVRLSVLPEEVFRKPAAAPASSWSPGAALAAPSPRQRWGGTTRLAQVSPIPSPAKTRTSSHCCTSVDSLSRRSPGKPGAALPSSLVAPCSDPGHPEEEVAHTDEAAIAAEAARRNERRHNRGRKVLVFCPVLQEHIERHPVQNEIPVNKWSKWLNPTQLRCLVSAMLDNTELCLEFSLESERKEEWEDAWVQLARRLNSVCFNSLTNLNTGLRMTVSEWKTCWMEFKTRVKGRLDAMTPKERLHNLGSLDCLLFSKDLYIALMESKGECLGDECPRKWCSGACVGVFSPAEVTKGRGTEE